MDDRRCAPAPRAPDMGPGGQCRSGCPKEHEQRGDKRERRDLAVLPAVNRPARDRHLRPLSDQDSPAQRTLCPSGRPSQGGSAEGHDATLSPVSRRPAVRRQRVAARRLELLSGGVARCQAVQRRIANNRSKPIDSRPGSREVTNHHRFVKRGKRASSGTHLSWRVTACVSVRHDAPPHEAVDHTTRVPGRVAVRW